MSGPHRPNVAELADFVAMKCAQRFSALDAHRVLAEEIWATLRTLGFTSGRLLATGDDPATFLGLPHTTGHGLAALTATVGPDHQPGMPLATTKPVGGPGEKFDVVIAPLPYNDVAFASTQAQARHRVVQNALALGVLDLTTPGGITVLLASSELLDSRYTGVRHELARSADLVGAVRLPVGIQRPNPLLTASTDLIVLRRFAPGDCTRGLDFTSLAPVVIDQQPLAVNSYYDNRADYLLGTPRVATTATGEARLTVTAEPRYFAVDLNTQLERIATQARHDGVVFTAVRGISLDIGRDCRPWLDDAFGYDARLDSGLDADGLGPTL